MTGHASGVTSGQFVTAQGEWVRDANFGLQLRAESISLSSPVTVGGMAKYLGSGLVKGIGAVYGKRLVETFGEHVFEVIEHHPHRLTVRNPPSRHWQLVYVAAQESTWNASSVCFVCSGCALSRRYTSLREIYQKKELTFGPGLGAIVWSLERVIWAGGQAFRVLWCASYWVCTVHLHASTAA